MDTDPICDKRKPRHGWLAALSAKSRRFLVASKQRYFGACGALISFLGLGVHPARLWLEIVPGVEAAAGGLISSAAPTAPSPPASSAPRPVHHRPDAEHAVGLVGAPAGRLSGLAARSARSRVDRFLHRAGCRHVFFAALALGRLAVVVARDAERAAATAGRGAGGSGPRRRTRGNRGRESGCGTSTKGTSMLRGFKNFLMQGDLIIIAVGLVVALAFAALIQAFVIIITPLVNAVGAGAAGEGLGWTINGQRIDLGAFIGAIIYFIIFVAVIYFLLVVPYRAYMRRRGTTVFGEPQPTKTCPNARHPIYPSTPPVASTAPPGSPPSSKRAPSACGNETGRARQSDHRRG